MAQISPARSGELSWAGLAAQPSAAGLRAQAGRVGWRRGWAASTACLSVFGLFAQLGLGPDFILLCISEFNF